MTSHGKVLDLLDDRYLDLKDVIGNVEPLPTLVPYEDYAQNVLVYRMDTDHEIFLGLIQDFTFRRAYEVRKELWTWLVQWEVDNSPPVQQPSTAKKVRLDSQQVNTLFKVPPTPRKSPALTIFERRTLDGALMLEEDMLRILIDIVQVASSLVPNFIEFLYRWVDYYEGDGKALKAALRWEIPSLWDFEYHPLVLPRDEEKDDGMGGGIVRASGEREDRARSVSASKAAELRQSSPTKKMHAQPKPDLAAIELQTFYTEESERLQYREVKFGIQPPKLEQALPPLINIPRDVRKRTKYYAACFKSRQRALYLLLEAGLTMRQINNYQKLQTTHPKETPETGDGDGLRNYQKDAKYAQAHYELKEKQIKQREIAISNKLAVEAQFAATHAVPDGAAGLPLIPPTPSYAKKDMAVEMMQRIKQTRARKDDGKINIVPKPLLGLMKSKVFEGAQKVPELAPLRDSMAEAGCDDEGDDESDDESDDGGHDESTITAAQPVSAPTLPRPMLPTLLSLHPSPAAVNQTSSLGGSASFATSAASNFQSAPALDRFTPPNIATSMQNLSTEPAQRLLPPLTSYPSHQSPAPLHPLQSAAPNLSIPPPAGLQRLTIAGGGRSIPAYVLSPTTAQSSTTNTRAPVPVSPSFDPGVFMHLRRQQEAARLATATEATTQPSPLEVPDGQVVLRSSPTVASGLGQQKPAQPQSPSPAAVLPPPRPGIARNAPSPLSLPPPKPSPFTTLAPQILATSPFLAQPVETGTPIQIYLPKILVPGNGIGPGGACMGDSGCIETDALMLGHEDSSSGKLILSKAILLPVGVWENTLRKARAGRWSVLETYACPSSHPAKGKGKRKVGDENKGCHGFVYDKLVQAYSMISSAPEVRENELTKRWRTSPGPMTSFDRGAVWEGWGVYVDRGVEMSVDERNDAMKSEAEAVPKAGASSSSEDYGPYRETDEALRRKREMEELMDEDGEIEEEEEMDD
ncbi:uncharacterized protein M421DRAFT_62859 [Didymella exigua CBS 183.55]|uniref:Uncharacterized protein n=1 Tax=Didymella exigua CBS 183.55 TaxID=1150837 RepID=A0A6A5RJK5_9PLEO|nr:uncharacterized protein M421DRAFT_62859 [Didymella exigua CBS 183.55]KAF1928565.1 hypothetical protein M421DRAFT_62859 [Didymella exigua CBS 183.55]